MGTRGGHDDSGYRKVGLEVGKFGEGDFDGIVGEAVVLADELILVEAVSEDTEAAIAVEVFAESGRSYG